MKDRDTPIGWLQVTNPCTVTFMVIIGWLACTPVFADDVSEKSNDSSDEISLHEGDDDLDASFLRKRVHVRVERLPLVDFATQLSKQVGVPVRLDRRAIADEGLLVDEPVTFSTEQPGLRQKVDELIAAKTPIEDWAPAMTMRLDQVLDFALREIDMTWFVEGGILHLTTRDHARVNHFINRSYSLTPFRRQRIEDQSLGLALSLQQGAGFGRWGGSELVTVGHVLTIRESFPIQRRLRGLLQAIAAPDRNHGGIYAAEEEACRKQLDRIVEADFLDTPLSQAIDVLAYQSKGRIFLDRIAIEESGGRTDQAVTFSLKDKSLREIFDVLLPDYHLTVMTSNGGLVVTTLEVARKMQTTRVYDMQSIATTKNFRDQITQAIYDLSSEVGQGTEGRDGLMWLENGVLVAATTFQGHKEIKRLVRFYIRNNVAPDQVPAEEKTTIQTRFYEVPSETATDLLTVLPATLHPETWQTNSRPGEEGGRAANGTIYKVESGQKLVTLNPGPQDQAGQEPGKSPPRPETVRVPHAHLVIRQSIAIHKQIDLFLEQLGLSNRSRGRVFSNEHRGHSGLSGGGFF